MTTEGGGSDRSHGGRRRALALATGTAVVTGTLVTGTPPAGAAGSTFVVTNTNDAGPGSLRDAITQANAAPDADTITFADDVTGTITLASEIFISNPVTIAGPGPANLAISGGGATRIFYLYGSAAAPVDIAISGLTLQDGNGSGDGGAILDLGENLTLADAALTGNAASADGGALDFQHRGRGAAFAATATTFTGNSAQYRGGGALLYVAAPTPLDHVTFTGNDAARQGGGLAVYASTGGALAITGAAFTSNQGLTGGGADIEGNSSPSTAATITGSTFSGNTALFGAGLGLKYLDSADVEGSTISGNSASLAGGGLAVRNDDSLTFATSTIAGNQAKYGGGVYAVNVGDTTVSASTISGNTASLGNGGGLSMQHGGAATVVNSTVDGNSSDGTGAGIYDYTTPLSLLSSTVTSNTMSASGNGAGLYADNAPATVSDSIIAGNTKSGSSPADVVGNVTASYSFVGDGSVSGTGVLSGDPMLGALTGNGGPTLTRLPLPGSPVFDAGAPHASGIPGTDQRGLARVSDGRIDMGSTEVQVTPAGSGGPAPGGSTTTTSTTSTTVPPSQTVDVPPPSSSGEPVHVTVNTPDGPVTLTLHGVEQDEHLQVSVSEVAASDTHGFTVLGHTFDVSVVNGSGDEGGTVCFPFDASELDGADPSQLTIVHFADDGTRESLVATVSGDQVCADTSSFSPFAVAILASNRLAGADGAATAAAISAASFAPGVDTVHVVARHASADAVAAGAAGGPVLLVDRDSVPAVTTAELQRLHAAHVVVVGGSSAVSDAVVSSLGATRIAGSDRAATAAALSAASFKPGVPVVYVVNGARVADALIAGAAASGDGGPVLMTDHDSVPSSTTDELRRLAPKKVVVIGGTASVSDAVVQSLGASRLAGADRYATSAAVAIALGSHAVFVARGDNPSDALAGAPAAGLAHAALLLVEPDAIPAGTLKALRTLHPTAVTILGGTAAVTRQNELNIDDYLPEG